MLSNLWLPNPMGSALWWTLNNMWHLKALLTCLILVIYPLAIYISWLYGADISVAKLLPTLIYAGWFYLFSNTLFSSQSLIERFARLQTTELPTELICHCRKVTIAWSVYFSVQILISIIIVIFLNNEIWLIYNGIIAYLLTALMFCGEYYYRKTKYQYIAFPSIKATIISIARTNRKACYSKK